MNNPWATSCEPPEHYTHDQETDIGLPSWSSDNTTQWLEPARADGVLWESSAHDTHAWAPSTYDGIALSLNHEKSHSTPPLQDSCDAVHEGTDAGPLVRLASSSRASEPAVDELDAWAESTMLSASDDEWGTAWTTVPSSEGKQEAGQPPDEWETARQEREKLNRAVPPESLASMLRHCQQVSDEIWPARELPETNGNESWQTGFDGLETIAKLLDQLIADDLTLPPPVQFSATATAKAMNEALRLTRHMSMSGSSPLSLLLASKGSLDWERSIKDKQDIMQDAAPSGWRVLEKDDRSDPTEESKQKKASAGLLSFWNRRVPSIPGIAAETTKERSRSPARSSIDNVQSGTAPQPPQAALSPKPPSNATAAPPPPSVAPEIAPAPSAVSRFLNRFSRAKTSSIQHSSLALSSHDLEFLSDIVPSASDPDDDGQVDEDDLKTLSSATKSSPLPPKLPPPLAPPPKPPMPSSRPSSIIGLGMLDDKNTSGAEAPRRASPGPRLSSSPNVPVLAPPLPSMSVAPFLRSQSPAVPPKDVKPPLNTSIFATPVGAATASTSTRLQSNSQPNSRSHSPFTLPLSPKVLTSLSIPPLLPPPRISPPQTPRLTPRPSGEPSTAITPSSTSALWPDSTSSFHDFNESDDEFSAFATSSSQAAPFSFSSPNPPQRSLSPPAHRTYERTHYPSSSSASSVLSPASQNSGDRLRSARSSHSASFDDFDDFVSPPMGASAIRTPSPPPLPVKPQHQHQHPHPINTFTSQPPLTYQTHTPSHSQTFASPTVHTGLINSSYSSSSVSHADHQRIQSLVNHAAARGGLLWPNSPESPEEPRVTAILPPPWPSASPASLTGEVDLFGNVAVSGSGSGVRTPPLPLGSASIAGLGFTMVSSASSPVVSPIRAPPGGLGAGAGTMRQLSPSLPPLPSTSTPLLSFSSLGTPAPVPLAKLGSTGKPMKPTQTGGLSAQDLSFFEGL
ncbi:hypothetical protein PAXRUDRAFT_129106 [Paxillus rubicundulus Ve08.2h10]|uniref:Unplaced genomic scaffold scaffold_5, whole genome shotgun sequence n=1 Tax=Paxillus rubicundulus Ve08.2h10 TaxID=930991 RepID=A0A0D0EDA0_9AGAM|nr:hypothetical protein PAXRUDRAFT_129106 [Paxillus rubicundulus Ve08.2h10]